MGKVEKTRFERNWTTFVSPGFLSAWKSPLKMMVDERRPISFKTVFSFRPDVVEFDPKGVFSFRPDGESRKNAF